MIRWEIELIWAEKEPQRGDEVKNRKRAKLGFCNEPAMWTAPLRIVAVERRSLVVTRKKTRRIIHLRIHLLKLGPYCQNLKALWKVR